MAHFPEIDNVLAVMQGKDPAEIRSLITLLADVALIATTRQSTRMFPPPAAFSVIFTRDSHRVGTQVYRTLEHLLHSFNFSGQGAFAFYKVFSSYQWQLNLNGATDGMAKQIVYHAMMGTYRDDLSLLSQITNLSTWNTREEFGAIFRQANTKGRAVAFVPVQQIYFSTLAQANQTGLLTSSYTQLSSLPCFSGRTKRKFGDAFFDYLSSETSSVVGGKSIQSLIAAYTQTREELKTHLEKNARTLDMGTTGWCKMSDVTPTLEATVDDSISFTTTGRYFLGKY